MRSDVHFTGRSIFLRRPDAHRLFRIDEDLRAEAAADIGRDDAELVLGREPDERREHETRDMRVLARRVERQRVRAGIVLADRGARLHRVRDQAIVDEVDLRHMRGGREGGFRRGLVAEMPVVDRVVGRDVVDRGAADRGLEIDDRRQHVIFDVQLLGGVLGLSVGVRDHDGDVVADIARLALSERGMGARLHRRAVLGKDRPAADQPADLVGRDVVAREHGDDARRGQGRGGVDALDVRMGVRRAHEIGVGLTVTVDVVGVLALAGDETNVFLALDGCADAGRAHATLPGDVLMFGSRFLGPLAPREFIGCRLFRGLLKARAHLFRPLLRST